MQSNNVLHEPTPLILPNESHHHQASGPEFLISQERLKEIVEINHTAGSLQQFGGVENIVSALKTNIDTGIIGDQGDLHFRRKAFASNFSLQDCSPQTTKSLRRLLLDAFRDTTIILLLCCATISLLIEIVKNGPGEGIFDGMLLFLAIYAVVSFGAVFRFLKDRWMIKKSLKHKKVLWVVRNHKIQKISESEVVVGDILCLQKGDQMPADGIFIDGNSFQLSDGLEQNGSINPSLFTGAEVVKGNCRMLVTSVGENTERSRLIRSIDLVQQNDHQKTNLPLLDAIDKTNSKLENIWLSLSLLLLIVQLARCFVWKSYQNKEDHNLDPKGVKNTLEDLMNESIKLMKKERSKVNGLVTMLCVLLFASRDGLPLAIFTSLLYASNKMKSCGAMIQKLPASAAIGLVTTLCTGKTTDLVLQHTKMAELWVGFSLIEDFHRQVDNKILDPLREGIFAHSLGHGQKDMSLYSWARAVLSLNMEFVDQDCSIVQYEAPDMDRNVNCLVIKKDNIGANKVLHVHWKGAPEHVLFMCSHYYNADGSIETLNDNNRPAFLQMFDNLVASNCHQRCLAFAYKREIQDDQKSPTEEQVREEGSAADDDAAETPKSRLESGLVFLGLVCLKNPYTPEVREAIEDCRKSGVNIKLLVEDDISTARIMAINCGLLRPEDDFNGAGEIIEAADFRASSEEERMNMIDNIHVVANSSPADKLLMVQCLRRKGERVAATASCVRDCPLLKEANVGIFMGDQCQEVSKKDGDILVLNNNFSAIPGIIKLGRRVCENVEKFILLQLTLEISAFTVNFIAAAAKSTEELSSFQVLWINLIMEVLGALAVAITTVHTRSPHNKSKQVYGAGPTITRTIYRNVAVQSIFQVTVILIVETKGKAIFQVNEFALKTIVFNCFFFCQVFLLISAIELKKDEILGGIFMVKNCLFLGIVGMIGILQVPLIEIMAVVAHWAKLGMRQWWLGIGIASFCVPLSWAANLIPSTK